MGPQAVGLREWLVGLWRFRGVLAALARKDFQVRYKRAALGILWSVAMPLLQSVVLGFIFSRVGESVQMATTGKSASRSAMAPCFSSPPEMPSAWR